MVAGNEGAGSVVASGPVADDRRRDPRHSVMLPGTIYRADGSEVRCVSENASVSGFEIIVGREFYGNEKVTLVLQYLGRIEVEVMRVTQRGFGCRILRTALPRSLFLSKLRDLVRSQSGQAAPGSIDQRRHARIVPEHKDTTVQLMGREPVAAELIDVSQSGAAVRSAVAVRLGQRVLLGRRPSSVVRVMAGGFAVQFDEPLAARKQPESPMVALV